jgi:hypothetical protein
MEVLSASLLEFRNESWSNSGSGFLPIRAGQLGGVLHAENSTFETGCLSWCSRTGREAGSPPLTQGWRRRRNVERGHWNRQQRQPCAQMRDRVPSRDRSQ